MVLFYFLQHGNTASHVGTIISTLPIDKNPAADGYSVLINCRDTIDSVVLDCLFEGLSNLDVE